MSLQKTLELYKGQTFSEPLEAEIWIYKQALKDMMERAKTEATEIPGDSHVRDMIFIEIEDLEKIKEDLEGYERR